MQVLQTLTGTVGVSRLLTDILYRVLAFERGQIFETVNWASLTSERGQIFETVNWTSLDFHVSSNSSVMLTDNHMNIILYQIFSSTISILLSSFLLFNLLLKALKNYSLPFSKLQHDLCKPTRTQPNVSQNIKNVGAR